MKTFSITAFAIFIMSLPATAAIIGGTVTGGTAFTSGGTFVDLTVPLTNPFGAPDSVGNDNFQSPNLFAFDEAQNITLAAPLTVEVGSSPIPAGTVVSSYYVFFDPGPTLEVIGNVNFDSEILGVITDTTDLAASDFLSNSQVNYLDPAERGLEAGDSVTISGAQQILFDTIANSPGDYVRVITAASVSVPEPASWAMFGAGLAAVAVLFQRRRRAVRQRSAVAH